MDEVIEKIVDEAMKAVSGFSFTDQCFILEEVIKQLSNESHICLMAEYGINEED